MISKLTLIIPIEIPNKLDKYLSNVINLMAAFLLDQNIANRNLPRIDSVAFSNLNALLSLLAEL